MMVQNVHSYEACRGSFNTGCNKEKVLGIQDQLENSLAGNTDYVFMELVRQKALEKYDQYTLKIGTTIDCFESVQLAEKCVNDTKKTNKCISAIKSYPECSQDAGTAYNHVLAQNIDMRISLSLWNPPGKPHEYNNREEDKLRAEVKHLSYVDGVKIEPLTAEEKQLSLEIFTVEQDNSFKEYLKSEEEERNKRTQKTIDWKRKKEEKKLIKKLRTNRNRKKRLLLRKGLSNEEIRVALYDPRLDDPKVIAKAKLTDVVITEQQLADYKRPDSFIDIMRYNDGIKDHKMNMMEKYKYIYLETVLSNPVLKYIKSPEPKMKEVHKGFESLAVELNEKRNKILNLDYDDLEQFMFFDKMIEEVLVENPFFCLNAINKKERIEDSRKLKENLFAFGGIVLCPFTGYGCAGAMFGGSVVNFIDTKQRLDTTMEYVAVPDMVSTAEVTGQAKEQGMSASMVLLSTPISLIGKVGLKAIGTDTLANSMKTYGKTVQKEGWKRLIIKAPESSETIYKNAFKQLKSKPDVHDYLDIIVQAPVVGISKLVTKKAYTFQPAEFALKKLEKKLLKGQAEFAGPVIYLGNFVDFRLFLVGYGAAASYGSEVFENKHERKGFAGQNFDSYDTDARFSKVKEIEKACKKSSTCNEDIDLIVQYNNNLVLDGVMVFDQLEQNYLDQIESKKVKKDGNAYLTSLLKNESLQQYGNQIFPNFYKHYPDGYDDKLRGQDRKIQRSIFMYDVMRLKISQEIQKGGIDKFLNKKEISKEFALFIKTYPEVGEILSSETNLELRKKKIGNSLNSWVSINQDYLASKNR
jgi:hypothetical protein